MAVHSDLKKRKRVTEDRPRKHKKIRKVQQHYSSGSDSEAPQDDEFNPVDLADSTSEQAADIEEGDATSIHSDEAPVKAVKPLIKKTKSTQLEAASTSDSESDSESEASNSSNPNKIKISKRNDPTAFANSISAILSSKLTSSKRADPVLARSAAAAQANSDIASAKLEHQAKHKLRDDKKAALEKGRVKDVLLGTDAPGRTGEEGEDGEQVKESKELEKRLKKTAQRGVVKLFNAVRQAQVRAEEAAKEKGIVGRARREEKMEEMSKKGFLELVAGGGKDKNMQGTAIEEA